MKRTSSDFNSCCHGRQPLISQGADGIWEVLCPFCEMSTSAGTEELVRERWNNPRKFVQVCPRYPVAKLGGLIPQRWIEALEHNQLTPENQCCRHPENHEIEARKNDERWPVPNIYIMHCTGCGRQQRRFCVGGGDPRPVWEVR